MPDIIPLPPDYVTWLTELKIRIHNAQQRATLAVNRELVLLYWQIGRDILDRQGREGWGTKVIERLAQDLRNAFPDMKGFSPRNLGRRPAAGFYIRHAKNLVFKNVQCEFEHPDERPSIVASDVDGFTLDGFEAPKPAGVATLRQTNVKNLTTRNCPGLPESER